MQTGVCYAVTTRSLCVCSTSAVSHAPQIQVRPPVWLRYLSIDLDMLHNCETPAQSACVLQCVLDEARLVCHLYLSNDDQAW